MVGIEFSQTQTITSKLTATYQHTLTSEDIANFVGNFTCMVEDAEGNSPPSQTLRLNGMQSCLTKAECYEYMCHCVGVVLVRTPFTVGDMGIVMCSNDGGVADRIGIVSEAGRLMTSQASVQTLTLTIDPITDSLHNSDITCHVTRNRSEVFTQTLPITVNGKEKTSAS